MSYDRAAGGYQSDCFPWRFDLDGRWLPEPEYAKYDIRDMLSLGHRVDGGRIFIRAPIPLPTYFTEAK